MNSWVRTYYDLGKKSRSLINFTVFMKISTNTTQKAKESVIENPDNVTEEKEQEIEKIRDKSRLRQNHRNILFDKKPYSEPWTEAHLTVKYNRKMYGRYGSESGVNPGIMWPTKEDIEARKEYEKVAYPFSIQEMVKSARNEIEEKELAMQRRHDRVVENVAKLEKWKSELKEKIAKKEAEALAVMKKKEKLVDEVRRHFGYTIDSRDEKFKEMLVLKEKQLRKKEKQAKLEERERNAIAQLMEKNEATETALNKSGERS